MPQRRAKNILIYPAHPAHVHFFRHVIAELAKEGFQCFLMARDKDLTLQLLREYGLDSKLVCVVKQRKPWLGLLWEFVTTIVTVMRLIVRHRIGLCMAIGGDSMSVASRLFMTPCWAFTDTEHAHHTNWVTFRFATKIFVPSCYTGRTNKRTVRYPGYHELAYLHPDRFKPNRDVRELAGLKKGEEFFIVRFVSWVAAHDVGKKGFSDSGRAAFVRQLAERGRVLLSSESELPPELEPYRLTLSPVHMHDLLYHAALYIGEGGTMASEAAVLGTPAIFVSNLTLGYLEEQEKKYGLTFLISDEQAAFRKALFLLDTLDLKESWRKKRDALLRDKIDVTAFIVSSVKAFYCADGRKGDGR
jgi:hypothetical protein